MMKRIPAFMDAEPLSVLAVMGHGDELPVVDRNFPSHSVAVETTTDKLITLGGMNAPETIAGILELMPLDGFVDAPLSWMDPSDNPGSVLEVCRQAEGREVDHAVIERLQLYPVRANACRGAEQRKPPVRLFHPQEGRRVR